MILKQIKKIHGLFLSDVQVSQDLFQSVSHKNNSVYKGGDLPVHGVTWMDAIEFCNKLSAKQGLIEAYSISNNGNVRRVRKANGYRLPTRKEWIIAAGDAGLYLGTAHISSNVESGFGPRNVISGRANDNGLYNMFGNVEEWCWDGPSDTSRYTLGCSWGSTTEDCIESGFDTSTVYVVSSSKIGFRIGRDVCELTAD